jgi:uncharacterized protein (DUF1499 family)
MLFELITLGAAVLSLAVLGLAGPAHRLGMSLDSADAIVRWSAHGCVAAAIVAIVAGVLAYRGRAWLRLTIATLAVVIGLTGFVIGFDAYRRETSLPSIHDITTDLENPPTFTAVIARRADAPNRLDRTPQLAELQRQGYSDLAPLTVATRPEQTFDRALAVAQAGGWEIVTADKSMGRIEATDTTRWFGFVDDISIRLTAWGSGTRVDVRSVSRTGIGDAGRNADRIRGFLKELQR